MHPRLNFARLALDLALHAGLNRYLMSSAVLLVLFGVVFLAIRPAGSVRRRSVSTLLTHILEYVLAVLQL